MQSHKVSLFVGPACSQGSACPVSTSPSTARDEPHVHSPSGPLALTRPGPEEVLWRCAVLMRYDRYEVTTRNSGPCQASGRSAGKLRSAGRWKRKRVWCKMGVKVLSCDVERGRRLCVHAAKGSATPMLRSTRPNHVLVDSEFCPQTDARIPHRVSTNRELMHIY